LLAAGRFNKFKFVLPILDSLANYKYVILADSDMAFAGFSWKSFFGKISENGSLVTR
jgi:hypothetical protein